MITSRRRRKSSGRLILSRRGEHVPSAHPHPGQANWLDPFALIGLGGLWAVVFIWILSRKPLVPRAYHTEVESLLNQGSHHGEDTAIGSAH